MYLYTSRGPHKQVRWGTCQDVHQLAKIAPPRCRKSRCHRQHPKSRAATILYFWPGVLLVYRQGLEMKYFILADAVKGERNHFFASLIIKLWWDNFVFMKICVKVTASQTSYSKNRPAFGFKILAFAENCSENFICIAGSWYSTNI